MTGAEGADVETPKGQWKWPLAFLGCCAIIALLMLGLGSVFSGGPDESSAAIACEEFVKGRLVSPATARFTPDHYLKVNETTWKVHGAVDAQNQFGAMIRNSYYCEVSYGPDGTWGAIEVSVQPK